MSNWRTYAADVIRKVIEKVGITDEKLLKKKLREAYPFGEKENHPYKIWLSECKNQIENAKRYKRKELL